MNSAPSSIGTGEAGSSRVRTRPPMRSRASRIVTERPASASLTAAAIPAKPAPMTMTLRALVVPAESLFIIHMSEYDLKTADTKVRAHADHHVHLIGGRL